VQNVYRGLQIIRRTAAAKVDQIGDVISNRYAIAKWNKWRKTLGSEYVHALQILLHADHLYPVGRSEWMQSQNSFNDALTRALIPLLTGYHHLPPMTLTDHKGNLVKFGVLLDANQPLGRGFPRVAGPFRAFNNRRNCLPGSHPYSQKGGSKNLFLGSKEQKKYSKQIAAAFREIVRLMDPHL
jgi:hypothetical protein